VSRPKAKPKFERRKARYQRSSPSEGSRDPWFQNALVKLKGKSRNGGQYLSTEPKAVKEGEEGRKHGSLTRKEVSKAHE